VNESLSSETILRRKEILAALEALNRALAAREVIGEL